MGTAAAGAALCASAFFSVLAVHAACTNPSPLPTGFAAPCPVFSLSATTLTQSQTLTLSATPQAGTDYIYTTTYVSEGSAWNPYTLSGNNAYPAYSSALASLTLSSTQLQTLSLGTHYAVAWDWLWDSTAGCYKGPGLNQCNTGTWRVQSFSLTSTYAYSQSSYYAYSQSAYVSSCLTSTTAWQNQAIAAQTGSFEITYDATPNLNLMDGLTGLSQNAAAANTDLAAIIWFNPSGNIQARNGSAYQALSAIPYAAGSTYHLRLDVNVPNHTYSAYVTPPGGTEKTIGLNYAFRTEQAGATSLNYWNLSANTGSHTVCNANVSSIAYTYSQSAYYAYSQASYYVYSQSSYYTYSQSAYTYTYSQSAYVSGCTSNCYYVSKSGSDSNPGTQAAPWLTINHAAAASGVSAGATVMVENGTYNEDVYIGKSGTAGSRITFKSQNKWGAVVSSSGSTQANLVVDIPGAYVTWQDFEVVGRNTSASGIKCNGGVACWILGNKIHDIGVNTSTCIFGGGVLDSSGSSVIDGNYIYNVSPPRTVSFRCNKQHGIYVDSDAGSPGIGGKVTNNLIMEVWSGWGIQLWSFNPNGWTVSNNTVVNTGYAAQNVGGPLIIDCGIDSSTTGTCDNNKFTNNILEHGFGGTSNYCFQQASSGSASPWGTHNVYDHNLLYDCGSNSMLSGQTVTNSVTQEAAFMNYTGSPTQPDTVLFNRTNSPELVGKTAIYRGERPAIFAGYLIRIVHFPELDPQYLNFCLNTNYAREFCSSVKTDGVSQSNINARKLGTFAVPYCSLKEQREIVRRVDSLFKLADAIEKRVAAATLRAERLTQAVLAKAFRGELVPTEAELARREGREYEPASVLLERIKAEREKVAVEPMARRTRKTRAVAAP